MFVEKICHYQLIFIMVSFISFAEKEKASENRPSILFTAYKTQRTSYNLKT